MKSATRWAAIISLALSSQASGGDLRETVLRNAALKAGIVPVTETHVPVSPQLAAIGKLLFESKKLSLDQETACASCHVDRFGSGDGLPNAIGTEGHGLGRERMNSGGDIIPRNTLPFWGRGGKGFDVFFWDGKVDASNGHLVSQFAGQEPSNDPLVIAVHLPPVQIGEMITDTAQNDRLEQESVTTAYEVYDVLADRIRRDELLGNQLADATQKSISELRFLDVANAIAAFIRSNFRLKQTRFHKFVFGGASLDADELAGGLIFYGKAGCAACHNGPYFSDLRFHAVPFPQAGFGPNGFGIDYGRFNVTLDVADRSRFRTPPLYNVSKTGPYSHSGSVANLDDAIQAHIDPLAIYRPDLMTATQRVDFYEMLKIWSDEPITSVRLSDLERQQLILFLEALTYDSDEAVREVE